VQNVVTINIISGILSNQALELAESAVEDAQADNSLLVKKDNWLLTRHIVDLV
jgi:hypothetical protein